MALSAGCHIEIRNGGSDTVCSGAFDPTQTAGMFTDGAATSANTSAPVFSSASYNFVAGDVDAYVFIGAGTNWTKGWYPIVSVASNVATLGAAALGYQAYGESVNTSEGCASVASPTGATWSIDYSQQVAAEFTCTDGIAAGAGSTLTSATIGFGSQMVGNAVRITAGTNCTVGHHVITSVAAGVATFNNAVTTGATANCTLYLGGATASPGYGISIMVAGNCAWLKYHASSYDVSSDSTNVSNGRMVLPAGSITASPKIVGYYTTHGDITAYRPTIKVTHASPTARLLYFSGYCHAVNIIFDLNGKSIQAWQGQTQAYNRIINCKAMGGAGACIQMNALSPWYLDYVEVTGFTGSTDLVAPQGRYAYLNCCYLHNNTSTGAVIGATASGNFSGVNITNSIIANNSGRGIDQAGNPCEIIVRNCVFYGNTDGIRVQTSSSFGTRVIISDSVFEGNSAYGINFGGAWNDPVLTNNVFYNNTSGATNNVSASNKPLAANITGTVSFFVNAANGDFRLNMKPGGGALLRGASYPSTLPGTNYAHRRDIGAHQHSGRNLGVRQ